jgi:hypothetical protein
MTSSQRKRHLPAGLPPFSVSTICVAIRRLPSGMPRCNRLDSADSGADYLGRTSERTELTVDPVNSTSTVSPLRSSSVHARICTSTDPFVLISHENWFSGCGDLSRPNHIPQSAVSTVDALRAGVEMPTALYRPRVRADIEVARRPSSRSAPTLIPIALAAPPVPNFPRLRALAFFGRRPAQSAECLVVAGVQKPAQQLTFVGKSHHWRRQALQGLIE